MSKIKKKKLGSNRFNRRLLRSSAAALLLILILALVNQNIVVNEEYSSSSVLGKNDPAEKVQSYDKEKIEVAPQGIENAIPQKIKTEIKINSKIQSNEREEKSSQKGTTIVGKDVKVQYEIKNGQLSIEAENENGVASKIEIENIQEEIERSPVKVKPIGDDVSVVNNNVGAVSRFPLKVNLDTHELEVTTPKGTKTVTVLPDEAVVNMVANNIIQSVEPGEQSSSTEGKLSISGQSINLSEKNGELVYEIKGEKTDRVLGLFPVKTKVTAVVSATTGKLVERQRSIGAAIADFFSF